MDEDIPTYQPETSNQQPETPVEKPEQAQDHDQQTQTRSDNEPEASPQGHQPNHPERINQQEYDDQEIDGVKLDTDFRVRWLKMNGYSPNRANMINVDLPSRPELHSQNVLPDDLDGRKLNKNRLEELMEDG